MRKHRRKIKRRKRKSKSRKRKNLLIRWATRPLTNAFTRLHTWAILLVEIMFLFVCAYWAYYEIYVGK